MATDHSTARERIPTPQNAFIGDSPAETLDNIGNALSLAQEVSRLIYEAASCPAMSSAAEHGLHLALECAKQALEHQSTVITAGRRIER